MFIAVCGVTLLGSSSTCVRLPPCSYLPRSIEERELVARTVFVGNVDRVVERDQLREFFENLCGEGGLLVPVAAG